MADTEYSKLLIQAVKLEMERDYEGAIKYYENGLTALMDYIKNEKDDNKKSKLTVKCAQYIEQTKAIKCKLRDSKYHKQIVIKDGATGYSYETIFSKYLTVQVLHVIVEDAYIRSYYQIIFFAKFCSLLRKYCTNLNKIILNTTFDQVEHPNQKDSLEQLKHNLRTYNIDLNINFSNTLHDRKITFSTGWIFQIGRGLSYFKKPVSKFSLDNYDYDLRQCYETTIDIYHKDSVTMM